MSAPESIIGPIRLAFPSKGRLKDQTEAWLADSGFRLKRTGGERGYSAVLGGLPDIEPVLLSAGDIAQAIVRGDVHLGVTGEDLLHELNPGFSEIEVIRQLGFGRADLVVAVPRSWFDITSLVELEDYAAERYAATGQRIRVATKYMRSAAAFFADAGLVHYRLVESVGATEATPAAGEAEAIVDITSSGATLAANGLHALRDGLILRSQAVLAASVRAEWSSAGLEALTRLINVLEARARAVAHRVLVVNGRAHDEAVLRDLGAVRLDDGSQAAGVVRYSVHASEATRAAADLMLAGASTVEVTAPEFLFVGSAREHLGGIERLRVRCNQAEA